jgi:hypothetical protein
MLDEEDDDNDEMIMKEMTMTLPSSGSNHLSLYKVIVEDADVP